MQLCEALHEEESRKPEHDDELRELVKELAGEPTKEETKAAKRERERLRDWDAELEKQVRLPLLTPNSLPIPSNDLIAVVS